MHNSDHIGVTHAGNLPRPEDLDALIAAQPRDEGAIRERLDEAVAEVVERQIDYGVNVVNDGEYVKAAAETRGISSYGDYLLERVTGFAARPVDPSLPPKRGGYGERDRRMFPGFYRSGLWTQGSGGPIRPGFFTPGVVPDTSTELICDGAIEYIGQSSAQEDIAAIKKAVDGKDVQAFIAALGPLSLGAGARNLHYATEEEYMLAVADAVRTEYKAVTDAGLILQVDEPEFLTTWTFFPDWTVEDLRRYLTRAVELINYAIRDLPPEQIRFHSCWGSGHRPHVNDIPLSDVADLMVQINAQAFTVESGNVRHQHEWRVWQDVPFREGTIFVPGVVSHATDLVEHPELVAERLCNYASIFGRESVQAGTDCGIGSRVGHPEIAWAKLKTMGEGAALATQRLWSRA